ncbi:hypothetical protein ESCO_000136 [Escovopsis weberi]|uniref:Secreted protein n=1 Tax=Escovopsis weberi TaxID=150374 RepID=A0A0M9VT79_ESCWE|nr:hypothetical protein ESCO_000136 [Escovopsis weberi]
MLFAAAVAAALSSFLAILICTGANATGACSYNVYNFTQCYQLDTPYYENVRTFAPDGEAFFCYPRMTNCGEPCFGPTGCTVGPVNFTYPHKYDFAAIGWNKHFKSFDCYGYDHK